MNNKVQNGPIVSPLEIPEIRDKIFNYLDYHDLLRCRLVSTTWAADCLYLLEVSNAYLITLRKANIVRHLEFISSYNITSLSFKYNVNFMDCFNNDQVTNMLEGVQKLLEIFGPNCIQSLSFIVPNNLPESTWETFYELLQSIGSKLLKLEIREAAMTTQRGATIVVKNPGCDWLKLCSIIRDSVPYLENLSLRESDYAVFPPDTTFCPFVNLVSFAGRMDTQPELLQQVAAGSPKLKSLKLLGSMEDQVPYRHIGNLLGFLTSCSETQTSMEHIEELEVGLGNEVTYQKISEFQFTSLKSFKINVMGTIDVDSAQLLKDFLKNNCPALTSLDLVFAVPFEQTELGSAIPEIPNLRELGIRTTKGTTAIEGISINKLRSLGENCRSLESMNFDLGICFYGYVQITPVYPSAGGSHPRKMGLKKELISEGELSTGNIHVKEWDPTFIKLQEHAIANVNKLCLTITNLETVNTDGQPTLKQSISQLHALFPNVQILILHNEQEEGIHSISDIYMNLFETFPGLKELEFKIYTKDWISEVLETSMVARKNLEGLKIVRISKFGGRPTPVSLSTLAKYLPNLVLVQIPTFSYSKPPWVEHAGEVEEVRQVRSNLVIQYL